MASRSATKARRPARNGARSRSAFTLPLRLAAGLLRWDRISLRPVAPRARRHRRRAHGGRKSRATGA